MELPKSEDGEWVRSLARAMRARLEGGDIDYSRCAEKLEHIALLVDELFLIKRKEGGELKLEKRVDSELQEILEAWLDTETTEDDMGTLIAAVWLAGRQIRSAGVVQGIGSLLPMLALGGGALDKIAGHKDLEELEKKYGRPKGGERRKR